ncbi:YncE family protein [Pendulispora albinea]|uniref:YNCE-like beta-propeller domain-containing protein n=1 Tax=Pendulispora albinea TaxID=2741071 RepID=A0ABZ2LVY1_9BACT
MPTASTLTENPSKSNPTASPQRLLATCNQLAHNVILVDPETLTEVRRIETPAEPHVIVYDEKRALFYVAITYRSGFYDAHGDHGREIVVIDAATCAIAATVDVSPDAGPHDLIIDTKRDRLYVTCESDGGCVLVYDLDGFVRIGKIPTRAPGPHWLALLPDGRKAYTGNKEAAHVSVLDLDRIAMCGSIPMPTGSEDLVVSPDGSLLYANDRSSPFLHVIRTDTDREIARVELPSTPHRLLWTSAQQLLVTHFNYKKDKSGWNFDKPHPGGVSVTDARTLKVIGDFQVGAGPLGLAATDDGNTVFVNNANDGTMSVVDMPSGKARGLVPLARGSHDVILLNAPGA